MAVNALKLLVCGASGKMGARVAALAEADKRFVVLGGVTRQSPPRSLDSLVARADGLIDFTSPDATVRFTEAAAAAGKPIVVGTTGFSPAQHARVRAAARRTAVLLAPNFSPGVAVLCALARAAVERLPKWDRAILETHHSQKKDAPSGTALKLAQASGASAIVSQRVGDVVGEHTLTLAGPFERLELTHRAHSRDVFAKGALEAALWLRGRRPGLYGLEDALELR